MDKIKVGFLKRAGYMGVDSFRAQILYKLAFDPGPAAAPINATTHGAAHGAHMARQGVEGVETGEKVLGVAGNTEGTIGKILPNAVNRGAQFLTNHPTMGKIFHTAQKYSAPIAGITTGLQALNIASNPHARQQQMQENQNISNQVAQGGVMNNIKGYGKLFMKGFSNSPGQLYASTQGAINANQAVQDGRQGTIEAQGTQNRLDALMSAKQQNPQLTSQQFNNQKGYIDQYGSYHAAPTAENFQRQAQDSLQSQRQTAQGL